MPIHDILRQYRPLLGAAILPLLLMGCSDTPDTESHLKAGCSEDVPVSDAPVTEAHLKKLSEEIDDGVLEQAADRPGDWLTYGGTYTEDRYSTLDQIAPDNVSRMGLHWCLQLDTRRGLQATPLAVDGILYFSVSWSEVYAVDARTGKVLWHHDPQVPREVAIKTCCGVSNRGLAIHRGSVFITTLDGRMISLDAATGEVNWSVMTVPEDSWYTSQGAVRVFDGKVLIGNGGADFEARGYITAYDAETGELVWRFWTVPGNPALPFEHPDLEAAARTWNGRWWESGGGGGTVWDSFVYDPELGTVYVGVGNGSPWNREIRSPGGGDNLYLSSIVALDIETGAYKWHYQTTPGDSWDYTATQSIILADLMIDNRPRKVLMQAPKNGFFYVIDRVTGELISAEAFSYVNWASHIDENGRPVEREGARYLDGKVHWIAPPIHGAHNWHPMAWNPQTGLVYIPGATGASPYAWIPRDRKYYGPFIVGGRLNERPVWPLDAEDVFDPDAVPPGGFKGELIAWDPVAQKSVWRIPMPWHYNGGLLTTASGLLMQGDAEGIFRVRDASSGEELWQYDVHAGVIAPPITYLVDGEQHVSVLVGWGGNGGLRETLTDSVEPGRLFSFRLGGSATGPQPGPARPHALTTLTTDASGTDIGHGFNLFAQACGGCHAPPAAGGGTVPDLARSADGVLSEEGFDALVRSDALIRHGMPDFSTILTRDQLMSIRSYVLFVAEQTRKGTPWTEIHGKLTDYQKQAYQDRR